MSEMKVPKGWEIKKLSEISDINPSKNELNNISDETEVTFVPMRLVDDKKGVIQSNEIRKISEVKKGYTYFRENDVLFAKITPCMQNGKSAIGNNLKNGLGFGSTEFHVIRPTKSVISKWIHYFVRNSVFLNEATTHFTGSAGQQRVPVSFLEDHLIPIPPLETQKKIVAKLDHIFEKLEEKKKQIISRIENFDANKINENYKNHLLKLAFDGTLTGKEFETIDGVKIPKGWELTTIGNEVEFAYGKNLPKPERIRGIFPVYGSNGIVGTHNNFLIDFPSIVIGRKGTVGALHKTKKNFWPTDVSFYTKILNPKKLDLDFLYYLLYHIDLQKIKQSGPKSGLNRNDAYKISIMLPKIETQKKIVKILDQKFADWENHKQELQNIQNQHELIKKHLNSLSSSILNDAFSGKLVT